MRYIDTGSRSSDQALGAWIAELPLYEANSFRMQSGYFTAEPLALIRPLLTRLSETNGPTTIVVGSNDSGTAAEDVVELLAAAGPPRSELRLGVVHLVGGLFHPKVLHVSIGARQLCYTGSANFTGAGVSGQNVEAGVLFDSQDSDSAAELARIAQAIDDWFPSRGGIRIISTAADIETLLAEGVLTDRSTQRARREAARRQHPPSEGARARAFRVRRLFTLPGSLGLEEASDLVAVDGEQETATQGAAAVAAAAGGSWNLVWKSAGLARRDLNIPTAGGTNPTGSMGLKRGDWEEDIDHRHYFRDSVFPELAWQREGTGTHETAEADLELWIAGSFKASATVTISHNADTTSKTYEQRNFMSALRWGSLRDIVADDQLLGWVLRLDRQDGGDGGPPRYRLRIDEE